MNDEMTAIFGEPISTYEDKQAIEDGILVIAAPDQYGSAVLVTSAIFEAINENDDGRTYLQKMVPLLMDAVMVCKAQPKTKDGEPEYLWTGEDGDALPGNVTGGRVWIGKNASGGITLMRPEDY